MTEGLPEHVYVAYKATKPNTARAVADTPEELAQMINWPVKQVYEELKPHKKGYCRQVWKVFIGGV